MKTLFGGQKISEIPDKQWSFVIPAEIDTLSDTEKMKLIRSRKRQNQDKVRKFFGSDLKIDVSLSMIRKYKLPAMMESDLPLTYFISFLIKYQGVENLFFLLEVEKFKETQFDAFESKKTFAQRIFNTFMENGLPMQINTKNAIIEEARKKLDKCSECKDFDLLFNPAHLDIYSMLVNVYNDFEKSDFYIQMTNDLTTSEAEKTRDNLTIGSPTSSSSSSNCAGSIYPLKAYYTALDSISFSVGCMEKIFDEKIASKRVSINRNRQIRRMIASFCEHRLKMDFPESTLNLRQSLLTDPDANTSVSGNPRSSIISNLSALSNTSQSNSVKRKDELDLF